MRNLPDEVRLLEDNWGGLTGEIPENAFAVPMGPSCVRSDISTKHDIKNRAHHPRWTQYWMSLWGATIEAISLAWRVPLQDVLEASDISSKPYKESVDADGRKWIKSACDVIRRPKKHHG